MPTPSKEWRDWASVAVSSGGDGRKRRGDPTSRWWRRPVLWVALSIPVLVLAYVGLLLYSLPGAPPGHQASFGAFSHGIQNGKVSTVELLDADNHVVYRSEGQQYWATLPSNSLVQAPVLTAAVARGIPVRVDQQPLKRLVLPGTYLLPSLVLVATFALIFLLVRRGGSFSKLAGRRGGLTGVTFADVAGNAEAVAEIAEVRDYLVAPERYRELGADPPRGVLLVGPPGTGKTLLARALAGEAGVPFFSISGTEFVEMYVGVGAARVRDLFRRVRAAAPAILFVDELDAAGRARSGTAVLGTEERDQTLNQLLTEMDGFERTPGVVLVGATNRPDILDAALLRRGRFDRQIVVDPPDRDGRIAILKLHSRGKRLGDDVNLVALGAQTAGFTGADLASVLNEAALLAARVNRSDIGLREVEEAVERVVAGNERRSRLFSPAERQAVACHEAGHAVVAWAVPGTDPVTKVSVVSRGSTLGRTQLLSNDRLLLSESQLQAQVTVLLAGMAAERLVLGEITTGSHQDLVRATRLARRMVCEFGMSDAVGHLAVESPADNEIGPGVSWLSASGPLAAEIDKEVRRITDVAFVAASSALAVNRFVLDSVTAALIKQETLRQAELALFSDRVVALGPDTPNQAGTEERVAQLP